MYRAGQLSLLILIRNVLRVCVAIPIGLSFNHLFVHVHWIWMNVAKITQKIKVLAVLWRKYPKLIQTVGVRHSNLLCILTVICIMIGGKRFCSTLLFDKRFELLSLLLLWNYVAAMWNNTKDTWAQILCHKLCMILSQFCNILFQTLNMLVPDSQFSFFTAFRSQMKSERTRLANWRVGVFFL